MSEQNKATEPLSLGAGLTLLQPFYAETPPSGHASMGSFVDAALLELAEKLGYRDGKNGASIPPTEWDGDGLPNQLRSAWMRGWKRSWPNDQAQRLAANNPKA